MRNPVKHELSGRILTERILGFAIRVHRALGPGLLESLYEECLCHELANAAVSFTRQQPIPVVYDGVELECGFRADIIVHGRVLVEIKSTDRFAPIHEAQIPTYLRVAKLKVGLLLNFIRHG
ncbi:MAG TPA: GxxExxY protein [Alphaproteobacteria bacterium]|jgi:GxxExxY protein